MSEDRSQRTEDRGQKTGEETGDGLNGEYLDVAGVARLLGISERAVYELFHRYIESGERDGIAHIKIGERGFRTTKEDVRRHYETKKKFMRRAV